MRRTPALVTALLGLSLVLTQVAWGGNGGIAPPDSASDGGSAINDVYWIVIGITAAVFLVVEGALVWFLFRFRRRPGTPADAEGPQIHGNTKLELVWTTIPFLILVAIIVVTIVKVPSVNAKPDDADGQVVVHVGGHQFYWEYTYAENGVIAVDHLRVPVDRPVKLVLDAYDVIHSWWVPALTGKRDTIPGRTNTLYFTPEKPGVYRGQCAELCGVQHAVMYTTVEVMPAAEFDRWLAAEGQAQSAPAQALDLGRQTWEGVCAKCHGLDGKGDYGPTVAGISTLGDEQGLRQLLAEGRDNPQVEGYMPAVSLGWPEDDRQLKALMAYIASNPDLAPAGAAQQGG